MHAVAVVVTLVLVGVWLEADTLILRDGRRVQRSLVSIRNSVVEFEEDRGFRGNRIVRFDRNDVRRIDLDDPSRRLSRRPDRRSATLATETGVPPGSASARLWFPPTCRGMTPVLRFAGGRVCVSPARVTVYH